MRDWAQAAWPEQDWSTARLTEGAFHAVLVGDHVVARISKQAYEGVGERVASERRNLAAATVLFVPVPEVLSGVVEREGRAGFLTSRLPGDVVDPTWERLGVVIPGLLQALRDAPERGLPRPRAWAGGERWPDLVSALDVPQEHRALARKVVTDVLELTPGPSGFVHGDLLYNTMWDGEALTGLIDLDHACWGDQALDVAPLVGTFGSARLKEVLPPDLVDRAVVHRASLSLQLAAAAELVGDHGLRDHAISSFVRRAGDGTLYEP